MRRGVTLPEVLLVLACLGALLASGAPRLAALLDRIAVERAARAVALAHLRARTAALDESRVALLYVRADSLLIEVLTDTLPQRRWGEPGPLAHGVSLGGPGRPLAFAPTGLPLGAANARFLLSRGGASRQVVVSRYGRVRVLP